MIKKMERKTAPQCNKTSDEKGGKGQTAVGETLILS